MSKQRSSRSLATTPHNIVGIHRLPPELIIQIVDFCSPENSDLAFTAAQVCRRWRRLLLRTPSVWRSVFLDHRISLWSEHIRRARGCLLDVILREPGPGGQPWTYHSVQWVMQPALPYIHRWKSLDIRFQKHSQAPSPFLCNAVLSSLCVSSDYYVAPMLEELVLQHPMNDDGKEFALFGHGAPRLRRMTTSGIRLVWSQAAFGNLTFLDYTHHRFSHGMEATSEMIGLLTVCSALRELRLCVDSGQERIPSFHLDEDVFQMPSSVHLPQLRAMKVVVLGRSLPWELSYVLSTLRLPNLKTMHFAHRNGRPRAFSTADQLLSVFLAIKSVQEAKVENGWITPKFVVNLLERASRLETMEVRANGRTSRRIKVPAGETKRSRRWLERCIIPWATPTRHMDTR
jgi:hypothetical protein